MSEGTLEAYKALRTHVEAAHREVQAAQRIVYGSLRHEHLLWTRLALNRTQNTLIKLLVHKLRLR